MIELTIVYLKEKFPPPPHDVAFDEMQYYRDLYEGNHENIFPRAQELAKEGQITKSDLYKSRRRYYKYNAERLAANLSTHHYIVVNFASVIAELPPDLLNKALGNISADTEKDSDFLNFVQEVVRVSKVQSNIWAATVQHQVDGGVAYRIRRDQRGTWFEWKPADLYFDHEDGLGADITWKEKRGEKEYLRVERQRLNNNQLQIEQLVFLMANDTVNEQLDINEYAKDHSLEIPEVNTLDNVNELMCGYLPNDETLLVPKGRSALRNIDDLQEEINWTITRDSIVFEKHGKPKLAIPSKLWDQVANTNKNNYGLRFVRNADLEVVSYDEKNGAVPQYIVWDAKLDESFKHVERLIDQMLAVSKTSSKAVGASAGDGAMSAKAILYEWIQSVIKTDAIKDKFDMVVKEAIRKCIILENALGGTNYPIVDPIVEWDDMLPKADSERDEEESKKYSEGVQSLETTVRNMHPSWSEKAIQAEVNKIKEEEAESNLAPVYSQPPKTKIQEDLEDEE